MLIILGKICTNILNLNFIYIVTLKIIFKYEYIDVCKMISIIKNPFVSLSSYLSRDFQN